MAKYTEYRETLTSGSGAPSGSTVGTIYMNEDNGNVYQKAGGLWVLVSAGVTVVSTAPVSPEVGDMIVQLLIGDIAVYSGGYDGNPDFVDTIDTISIANGGTATDFGNLQQAKYNLVGCSNGPDDRGLIGGGHLASTARTNEIDYVTISTPANALDYGNLATTRDSMGSCSNNTNQRGIWGGGFLYTNVIEYRGIDNLGNTLDFGDLTQSRDYQGSAHSNGINERGIFGGGALSGVILQNTIDYITISSTGNATDFGDLTETKRNVASTSNLTNERGVFYGGTVDKDTIEYITINSTGNATNFGTISENTSATSGASNGTNERGTFGGGNGAVGGRLSDVKYITINTPSDSTDYGDLTIGRSNLAGFSNA